MAGLGEPQANGAASTRADDRKPPLPAAALVAKLNGDGAAAEALKPGINYLRWPEVPRHPLRFSLTVAAGLGTQKAMDGTI